MAARLGRTWKHQLTPFKIRNLVGTVEAIKLLPGSFALFSRYPPTTIDASESASP